MAVKLVTITLAAIAFSCLLSYNNVEATKNLVEKVCFGAQFPTDCTNSITKYLDAKANDKNNGVDYKAALTAGLKVLIERTEEGIKEIEKLKSQSQGVDGAKLGMVQAYYKMILSRSKNAIEALDGEDYGTLEFELDSAVKTSKECEDLVPKSSPVRDFTLRIHMAAKNNLGFGNHVGSG